MKDKNPIFRSLAMIEERIQEKLTVEMLAEGIHFSKYHYQRIFRETVGETVMGYVTRRRLFLAAEELVGTEDSVLEIALRYGYDSHEGFTRCFKAYLGVTPTEYRRYHSVIGFPGAKKEENAMLNSKITDEMIRELNSLIVQARETAADTRKQKGAGGDVAVYAQVWEFASRRAEKMAEELKGVLDRITVVSHRPDEISARFLIIKAVEDAVFEACVTAFQVGLMVARAMPEQRAAFRTLCEEYDSLAHNARIGAGKIVDFLNELSALIFQDMRKNAEQKLQGAVEAGMSAAGRLSAPDLPYGYIADGVREIAEELDSLALEEVTATLLEDAVFRMETILFAADMDILRAPQHRQLFDGILIFREKLGDAAEFFRNLSGNVAGDFSGAKNGSEVRRTTGKMYSDLAAQESILLFYLKGEIQKLGGAHLDKEQKAALSAVCVRMDRAVRMARNVEDKKEGGEIVKLLCEAYVEMTTLAEKLGVYGGAVQYLAEEVKKPLKYLPV